MITLIFSLLIVICLSSSVYKPATNYRTSSQPYRALDRNYHFGLCPNGYAMTGLYRGTCNKLSCIEYFRCARLPGGVNFGRCRNIYVGQNNGYGWRHCPTSL